MIDGKYHYEGEGYTKDGRRMANITIDTCKYMSRFETMVLRNSLDIECKYADTIEEAEEQYNDMVHRYTELYKPKEPEYKPLTGKYKKLSEDLKAAIETAKLFDNGEDGGTCNFDSPSLALPRWNESKVKQAAKEAGTSCFKWELYGGARYVFTPPTRAQGNRRCRVSEAMCKALTDLQYDVLEYCAMD